MPHEGFLKPLARSLGIGGGETVSGRKREDWLGWEEEGFSWRVARHWDVLPREVLGAWIGIQGLAGPASEQPHLEAGVPVVRRAVGPGALFGFLPAPIVL